MSEIVLGKKAVAPGLDDTSTILANLRKMLRDGRTAGLDKLHREVKDCGERL